MSCKTVLCSALLCYTVHAVLCMLCCAMLGKLHELHGIACRRWHQHGFGVELGPVVLMLGVSSCTDIHAGTDTQNTKFVCYAALDVTL